MIRKEKDQIQWLEFELLKPFPQIRHGVFLNFPLGDRDPPENLIKAFELLEIERGVKLKQCHQANIYEVKKTEETVDFVHDYDGMLTAEKDIGLLIRHADCQATLFFDPKNNVIGNVHCGWRGSVQNIYQKTVEKMVSTYGTRPEDLIVCIGPSLGPENAEFKFYRQELPESFWAFQVRPTYFDFWAISRFQLTQAGVLDANIEIANICTYENVADCFSYRRNKLTPNQGTIIGLKRVS